MSRVGHVAPREASGGGACREPAGPRGLAGNQAGVTPTKAISRGPPPCSFIERGYTLTDGRTGGSSQRGERDGGVCWFPATEKSHGVFNPVTGTLAPGVRAPWRQWAAYRGMQLSCGAHGTAGHDLGERGCPLPEIFPRESPRPGRGGFHWVPGLLPWAPVLLARAQVHRR